MLAPFYDPRTVFYLEKGDIDVVYWMTYSFFGQPCTRQTIQCPSLNLLRRLFFSHVDLKCCTTAMLKYRFPCRWIARIHCRGLARIISGTKLYASYDRLALSVLLWRRIYNRRRLQRALLDRRTSGRVVCPVGPSRCSSDRSIVAGSRARTCMHGPRNDVEYIIRAVPISRSERPRAIAVYIAIFSCSMRLSLYVHPSSYIVLLLLQEPWDQRPLVSIVCLVMSFHLLRSWAKLFSYCSPVLHQLTTSSIYSLTWPASFIRSVYCVFF